MVATFLMVAKCRTSSLAALRRAVASRTDTYRSRCLAKVARSTHSALATSVTERSSVSACASADRIASWSTGSRRRLTRSGASRNAQSLMEAAHHCQGQRPAAGQNIGDARQRAEVRHEVLAAQALLLHSERDGVEGLHRASLLVLALKVRHHHTPRAAIKAIEAQGIAQRLARFAAA